MCVKCPFRFSYPLHHTPLQPRHTLVCDSKKRLLDKNNHFVRSLSPVFLVTPSIAPRHDTDGRPFAFLSHKHLPCLATFLTVTATLHPPPSTPLHHHEW
jgi:hypothetical protein